MQQTFSSGRRIWRVCPHKNKDLKAVAASATVTALFGITEPAIYGANLRLKPMIYAVASSRRALMGWGGSGTAFANQGLLTIPVYAEAGTKAFICYLLGCGIAFWCISINDFSRL